MARRDPPPDEKTATALAGCKIFAAIGASGAAWPTAGFVQIASQAESVELTPERSMASDHRDEVILYPATQTAPHWVSEIAAG